MGASARRNIIHVRLSDTEKDALDAARGRTPRSDYIRAALKRFIVARKD